MTTKKNPVEKTAETVQQQEAPIEEHEAAQFFRPVDSFGFFERGEMVATVLNLEKYIGALNKMEEAAGDEAGALPELGGGMTYQDLIRGMQEVTKTVHEICCTDPEGFEAWSKDKAYMDVTSFFLDYANTVGKL